MRRKYITRTVHSAVATWEVTYINQNDETRVMTLEESAYLDYGELTEIVAEEARKAGAKSVVGYQYMGSYTKTRVYRARVEDFMQIAEEVK